MFVSPGPIALSCFRGQVEFGTKLVPNSFILVLGTYGAVVEWALTVWETVKGWK